MHKTKVYRLECENCLERSDWFLSTDKFDWKFDNHILGWKRIKNSAPRVDCFDEVWEKVESLLDYLKTSSTKASNSFVSHFWRQIFKIASRSSEVPKPSLIPHEAVEITHWSSDEVSRTFLTDFKLFLLLNACFDWLNDWFMHILIEWLIK